MSRFAIAKNIMSNLILGKEGGKTLWQRWTSKEEKRVDEHLPFNIRLFSRIDTDLTEYLLAEPQLTMDKPLEKGTITEIGVIKRGGSLTDYVLRITPDNSSEDEHMTMLMVEADNNKILDTKIFTLKGEIYPQSPDEWDTWLNEENGILGAEMLTSPDGIDYYRQWGEGERVSPLDAVEDVITDRYGKGGKTHHLSQMLFARDINNKDGKPLTKEYALVSVIDESYIEILIGTSTSLTEGMIAGA